MPHQLSVSTALFDGHPLEAAIEEIAAAGVRAIEFAFIQGYIDFDELSLTEAYGHALGQRAEAVGLKRIALSAHMDLGAPDAVEMLTRRLHFARACGAGILITNSSSRGQRDRVVDTIGRVLDTCRERSVVLALENPGDGDEQLIGSAQDASELLCDLDHDWVRFNYDFGNAYSFSGGRIRPEDDVVHAEDVLVYAHLKEIIRSDFGWSFAPIGGGELRWQAIFSRLDQIAPELPIGLELPMRASRPDRNLPVVRRAALDLTEIRSALLRSVNFVRSVTSVAP